VDGTTEAVRDQRMLFVAKRVCIRRRSDVIVTYQRGM